MMAPRARATASAAWLETAAACGMFSFGVVIVLVGAILPLLAARLSLQLAASGNLFLAMNAAMLIATIGVGPLLDRHGARPALLLAPVATAAAVAGIATARGFTALVASGVLLGLGGAVLNATTNMLVADLHQEPQHKNAALNRLGVFFGVGALFIPLSIGALLARLGLDAILFAAAGLALVPAVISLFLRFPRPKQTSGLPLETALGLARNPLVLAFAFLLFLESGNEFVMSGFLSTYLTREAGVSIERASYILAGYWLAVMLSRVLLSRWLLVWNGSRVVLCSAAGVLVSVLAMSLAPSPLAAAAAVWTLGLAISPIFPTTLGLAGGRFATHSGTIFGFLIAVALAGGVSEPWIVGHAGQAAGLRAALLVPAAAAGGIFVVQLWISRRLREPV